MDVSGWLVAVGDIGKIIRIEGKQIQNVKVKTVRSEEKQIQKVKPKGSFSNLQIVPRESIDYILLCMGFDGKRHLL